MVSEVQTDQVIIPNDLSVDVGDVDSDRGVFEVYLGKVVPELKIQFPELPSPEITAIAYKQWKCSSESDKNKQSEVSVQKIVNKQRSEAKTKMSTRSGHQHDSSKVQGKENPRKKSNKSSTVVNRSTLFEFEMSLLKPVPETFLPTQRLMWAIGTNEVF